MRYFGMDRVVEPVGAIPSTAWKLNNDSNVGPGEIRVALSVIKLEDSNFDQICSTANYVDSKVKNRIIEIIDKRGKLQNPYTESGGILCGTIEEIFEGSLSDEFKVGDEIISSTSICGIPMHIDEITHVDYNYGEIYCKGYAILFEATKFAKKPHNVELKGLLCALDEEGSFVNLNDIISKTDTKKIGIFGSNLTEVLLYSKMAHNCHSDSDVVAVIDSNSVNYTNEAELLKAFKGAVDRVYLVDVARPMEAFNRIILKEQNEFFDILINLDEIKGSETIVSLLVKQEGILFHTGIKKNIFQNLLAIDCMGKEASIYSLDGYSEGVFDFAVNLVAELQDNFTALEKVYQKRTKSKLKSSIPFERKGLEANRIGDFVFMSPITADLVENTLNIAQYDCNVIIQGETGVGKERILDLIHQNSPRKSKPCIKINCATIQENLAESEFFGYEKGSFTGASAAGKEGYFEMANNGTLFLDEIGSLPLQMQSKLLRVLQENAYYRVGGTEQKHVNVRVICANNIPLKKLVEEGKFREDLFYRLNICMLEIPPLRRRKEDIMCLSDTFIKRYSNKYGVKKEFSDEALERMCAYHWPGNVRELENTVHRLYISEQEEIIDSDAIDRLLDDSVYNDLVIDIKKEVKAESQLDFAKIMDEQEKRMIAYALKKEKTTRKAAEFLGIPQATLARKKVKYNL